MTVPSDQEQGQANQPAQEMPPSRQRTRTQSRVTMTILVITIAIYLLQELTRMGIAREPFLALNRLVMGEEIYQALLQLGWGDDPLVMLGGKFNPLIELGQLWRFLTPALLHASIAHIGFNMYALFAIGSSVETYYGSRRYLALYVLGAFGGTVLSFLFSPAVSIGASGAIFAIIGAETAFIFQNRKLLGGQAGRMLTNSLFIILINFFLGLSSRGIDNWGHLGGLLAGLVFGWFGGPIFHWQPSVAGYQLEDTRSSTQVWVAWLVFAAIFAGIALFGFDGLMR